MRHTINLMAKDGHSLAAYLAEPEGTPVGAVVILQEIWGVNDHIRKVTDGYAAEGYMAIAPALFDRVEADLTMDEYNNETRQRGFDVMQQVDQGQALLDIGAAVEAVSGAAKVGIVGFCFGGRLAWLAAARVEGVSAAVAYYGGGIPSLSAEQPRCPVIFHFGERDQHIPVTAVKEFGRAHETLPIYLYDADHGFNCEQRGSYHEPSARLARQRTLEFLSKHLGTRE